MKAKINVPNIKGYLQAHYRKAIDELGFLNKHIVDQAAWRLDQVKEKSPECYNADKCVHCGCEVSSKVFEDRACERECYPKMMTQEEWEKFNTNILESSIMIILEFGKEETLADVMQNNPNLTLEQIVSVCPEFKDEEFSSWNEAQ